MLSVLALIAFLAAAAMVTVLTFRQSRMLREAQRDARQSAWIAGRCQQALIDACTNPLVDDNARTFLNVALHEIRQLQPRTREDLP